VCRGGRSGCTGLGERGTLLGSVKKSAQNVGAALFVVL